MSANGKCGRAGRQRSRAITGLSSFRPRNSVPMPVNSWSMVSRVFRFGAIPAKWRCVSIVPIVFLPLQSVIAISFTFSKRGPFTQAWAWSVGNASKPSRLGSKKSSDFDDSFCSYPCYPCHPWFQSGRAPSLFTALFNHGFPWFNSPPVSEEGCFYHGLHGFHGFLFLLSVLIRVIRGSIPSCL